MRRRFRDERAVLAVVPRGAAGTAATIAGGGALAFAIGRPRRSEYPVYFPRTAPWPSATPWWAPPRACASGARARPGRDWYRDVFAPTLRPLTDHVIDAVLVTHGPPVLHDGRRALQRCLAAEPVTSY